MSIQQRNYSRKGRYRVFADGSIYDNEQNKVVGFIYKRDEIEEGFRMNGKALERFVQKYL